MVLTIAFVICVVILVLCWRQYAFRKFQETAPPLLPGALPIIGHALKFLGDNKNAWNVVKELVESCKENGGVVWGFSGPILVYGSNEEFCNNSVLPLIFNNFTEHIMSNNENTKLIVLRCKLGAGEMRQQQTTCHSDTTAITDLDASLEITSTFLDKPYLYTFFDCLLHGGLVTTNAERWKYHRKLLNPNFNAQRLNSLIGVFNEQSRQFVSSLSNEVGRPFLLDSLLVSRITKLSVATSFGLSEDDDTEISDKYAHSIECLAALCIERVFKVWLHLPLIFNLSSLKKPQEEHKETVKKIMETGIKKRSIVMKKSMDYDTKSDEFKPLVDQLLVLKAQEVFNDDDIMGHLNTFVAATFDTTASAICFVLLLLGQHQDVQGHICHEIIEVIQDRDCVTKHDLPKLVYLNAVVKEGLRLFPPAPIVLRKLDTDIKIKDFILKAGGVSAIILYGINRSPIWGKDADQFRPERWLEPDGVPPNANAFATFSLGKRNCIGRQYSFMVIKTMLVHILRRYRVHANIENLVLKLDVVLKPVSGHEITLEPRE